MEKKTIFVSQLLEDLNNGLTREEIAEKYGLSKSDVKKIFTHPKLKGKKPKSKPSFELIDDENEPDFKDRELGVIPEGEIRGTIPLNQEVEVDEQSQKIWGTTV